MVVECSSGVRNACLTFDPPVESFANPIENVLVLRMIVLCTWFPILPLMYWARSPPELLQRVGFIKSNWYEICYYSHITVAFATILLALISRFDVFYPVLPSWILYAFDRIFDRVFSTVTVDLRERKIFARSKKGIPNSMRLRFKQRQRRIALRAGQWVYVQIPDIDKTWHPFSLASASSDELLDLHVGVVSSENDWRIVRNQDASGNPQQKQWKSKSPTWTYRVFQQVNKTNPQLKARIMGPYGWSFSSCFDPKFGGSIVIGAGTGLTAAESVLRETIHRRNLGIATPGKVWFIWSCREVDDLLWCWHNLVSLLVETCLQKTICIDVLCENSNMLDWLGVSIYVTRADAKIMNDFVACLSEIKKVESPRDSDKGKCIPSMLELGQGETPKESIEKRIKKWLLTRIIQGGLADKEVHVSRYLNGCRAVLDETESGKNKGLSVCYCGPSSLSVTIAEAVSLCKGGTKIEFSADHQ